MQNYGDIEIEEANEANIPVDIWVNEITDEFLEDNDDTDDNIYQNNRGKWVLKADNYMPRKSRLSGENAYLVIFDSYEELAEAVSTYILPLYQTAVSVLEAIISKNQDHLYYWNKKG